MKTTENISLAGYAFVIETDAYNELEEYLNDIRASFSADESAEEIVSDIEERIGELLNERCISGMVVDLAMVRDIKGIIGNPKEMAQDEAESSSEDGQAPAPERKRTRHLYRNLEEKLFAGVCSGLGTYFGIDKVFFRIIFMVLFIIGLFGWSNGPFGLVAVVAYICLWIAMPAARTAEQKRDMKGKPLNLDNYKSKDFDFEKEVKDAAKSPAGKVVKRTGGIFLGMVLLLVGLGGLIGCVFMPSIPVIISNEFNEHIAYWGSLSQEEQLVQAITTDPILWWMILAMLGIFCVWFLYNSVMLLFNLKSPSWRPGLILFIAWVVSIFAIAGWVIKAVADALPLLV